MRPPLLPQETLQRVLRLARFDGIGVLALSGAFALGSAATGNSLGALIGVLVAAAGAMELHGAARITAGDPVGSRWLVRSQIYLLIVILVYIGWRLQSYDAATMQALVAPALATPEMQAKMQEAGTTEEDMMAMLRVVYYLTCSIVAIVTILYQGGLAIYYRRRSGVIERALEQQTHAERSVG